ncbi:MAG: terminase large subunit [Oscillospiraceae bacterium]
MGREDMIRADMESVGTYNAIFESTIKQLAKAERQLSRSEKEWRNQGGKMVAELTNKTGATYTAKDPYWAVVESQRKDIIALRNQLGLTPTGLNKVRNKIDSLNAGGRTRIEQLLDNAHEHALDHSSEYCAEVDAYIDGVLSGATRACPEIVQTCRRYVSDLDRGVWDFRTDTPCEIIAIIETMICHQQGEFLDASPLRGTPFILLPYHKFCLFAIFGFYIKGTNERRIKEGLIFVPRKNIKTTFAAAIAFALALYERASGSKVYEVGGALKQALEGFDFLKYNVHRNKLSVEDDPENGLRIIDNNMERSISGDVGDGYISINALASSPDKQDSFNCNIIIADEMHTYKNPKQYQVLKDATKAYTNKLVLGISSGGDKPLGFCAQRVKYCKKILNGTVKGEAADSIFVFIAMAPQDENGDVDYTNPEVLASCSPGWGHSIRPQDMINDAMQAKDDPQMRSEFFNKSLNVFTASIRAWFDIEEFQRSDEKYSWTIQELSRLPIKWYGGTDLSKLHDLTAACLFGNYKGVDIIIPHCWFPVAAAVIKAEEDQIPLFGWRDDGWLDMCNDKVVNHSGA